MTADDDVLAMVSSPDSRVVLKRRRRMGKHRTTSESQTRELHHSASPGVGG